MRKVLGLTLLTVFLLGYTSCTKESQTSNLAPTKALATATPAPPSSSPTPSAPATATVKNNGLKWQDDASGTPVTTIQVGGTVTWTITSATHSLEAEAPSAANGCDALEGTFNSDDLGSGDSVTRTFTKAGTFGYHCGIHGGSANCKSPAGTGRMPGVIKVVP